MRRLIRSLWHIAAIAFLLAPIQAAAAPRLQDTGDKLVIVIDPGHGGENLGTTENNHEEKSMTLVTALAMYDELRLYDNVEVYLTRTEDKDMTLKERAEFAQSVDADFLFSIHYNASENHELYGSEVWVPLEAPFNGYGYQFGCELLKDMKNIGLLVRGVKTRLGAKGLDYYGILRESAALQIPAVIIEHCHVDEPHDEIFCDNDEKLKDFGRMDAAAAARYFGLKSSEKGLDFSDYSLVEASAEISIPITVNSNIQPLECRIECVESDYENGRLILSVHGTDENASLLYYSYSIDGGTSYSAREPWPGNDTLTGACQEEFTLTLEIPPGICPEVVVRAYNTFDLCTESNHYESPWVFPFPPEEPEATDSEKTDGEEQELAETNEMAGFKDLDVLIAVVLFTIAIILTLILISRITANARRRKRRKRYQRRNEDGRSRNHPR